MTLYKDLSPEQRRKATERMRLWRKNNPDKYRAQYRREMVKPERRAYSKAYLKKRALLARAFMDAAMADGCVDCGTKEQVVLQFDHVRGTKVKDISQMILAPLPRLFEELDKCDVRCANCHARVTAQRKKAA